MPQNSTFTTRASRWPTIYQWGQFFKVLSKKERSLFFIFLFLFFTSFGVFGFQYYISHTEIAAALGGRYTEGIISESPRYLNPVLSPANDADRDMTRLIFSSLLKYDSEGNLIPDLAESFEVKDSGKTYEVFLKKNALWHDGSGVTADDIIFTLQLIQNRDYQSPLRLTWQGVEIEKIDDFAVRFKIKNVYSPFLYNLTFGILPRHIWQTISPSDFSLNKRNLNPVGSGPYVFSQLEKNSDGTIKSIELTAFKKFYLNGPFIENLTFKFYPSEDDALAALRHSEIEGINYISPTNIASIKNNFQGAFKLFPLSLPRYFSVFINQSQSKALADKNVRLALAYAIDKEALIRESLGGFGQRIDSPIMPGMVGYTDQTKIYDYNPDNAKKILEEAGWKDLDQDGILEKDGIILELKLLTIPWKELMTTSTQLMEFWRTIGVKLNIEIKEPSELKELIRSRQYQLLLFGEVLNIDPDPFAFWHSSQIKDPGQNLSLYENPQVDAILQDARQDINQTSRAKKYEQFSQIIANDLPAIFLYAPDYLYIMSSKNQGVNLKIISNPSDRFFQIENWYNATGRTWKK